jgi:flagellin
MASVINTNVSALMAQDSMTKAGRATSTAMQRLSTGLRINSAKDDAAGLAIGDRMTAQTRGLNMAIRNANDGISLMQTAEGAMDEVTNMLQRMRELAVQSVNSTNTAQDRVDMDAEVQQLKTEIDRVAKTTQFNNINLLDGTFTNKTLQIGDKATTTMKVDVTSVKVQDLGMGNSAGGGNVIIGGRQGFTDDSVPALTYFTTASSMSLVINGVIVEPITSTTAGSQPSPSAGKRDLHDVVAAINASNTGVTASAFNEVVAKTVGTGILSAGVMSITVTKMDTGSDLALTIGGTNSMQDLVDQINSVGSASTVQAKLDESGKLVLFNNSGSSIQVSDQSATSTTAFNGRSGFSQSQRFNGMLKLESTTGGPISIGTTAEINAGTADDEHKALAQLGLQKTLGMRTVNGTDKIADAYSVVGAAITASTTEWVKGEMQLNGVDIWRDGQVTDTTRGKVDLINSFADQTGVTADIISDFDGAVSMRLNSVNNTPISIALGNTAMSDTPGLAAYTTHGFREQNVGAADFDGNKPTYGSVAGGGSLAGMNVLTEAGATAAITMVDNAIAKVDTSRAKLGAYQNRLTSTVNNLTNVVTNTEASRSRIMDTDYSKETTALAKSQIISQAATAMLAQANQSQQSVLSLLK